MTYSGLTIETTVHDTNLSSHAIPAYPEYNSTTTFDAAFYAERRAENDALIGAAVDYQDDPNQGPGAGGGITDNADAYIDGPAAVTIGNSATFSLQGTNASEYVNDYQILWTVPAGQATIWGYESDVSDIRYVMVGGYQAGAGVVTCTMVNRNDSLDSKTVTLPITIS